MSIELHIFTNSTRSAPSTTIIRQTYNSFVAAFGKMPVATVWMDRSPNIRMSEHYRKNLLKNFPVVVFTKSLSDGYVKAIKNSDADYLFMLEHDWFFKKELIYHSLKQITQLMADKGIYHLRFNKRNNEKSGWEKHSNLVQKKWGDIDYVETNILSNNPHIIERRKYLEFIEKGYIEIRPGSKGVEELMTARKETCGAIYGPLGYENTVFHTDGRKVKR